MRLVALSIVLPLALGVSACVAPGADSVDPGVELADEVAGEVGTQSGEITEKATEIVTTIEGLLNLNRQWNQHVRDGATTPEARRQSQEMVRQMRDAIAKLPAEAEWVTSYVQEHKDAIKVGFEKELASEEMQKSLGAERIQKLLDMVNRAGGVDAIILKSTAVLREHSHDASELLGQGKKMPIAFFSGMAGTVAGANAARENWRGVVVTIIAAVLTGGAH